MRATATAKQLETHKQVAEKKNSKNNIIDPGTLQIPADLELLREQAAALNPNYQISCILAGRRS